jgi:hypothetical protein
MIRTRFLCLSLCWGSHGYTNQLPSKEPALVNLAPELIFFLEAWRWIDDSFYLLNDLLHCLLLISSF